MTITNHEKLTNKELSKMICIACSDSFGSHSKREMIKCAFRMQGTLVYDTIANKD
jgi:hypothetical protein